jgi:hypothetical protein
MDRVKVGTGRGQVGWWTNLNVSNRFCLTQSKRRSLLGFIHSSIIYYMVTALLVGA